MTQTSGVINKVKTWAFPALLSIVCWFTVNTLREIRADLELVKADVKLLLAQSNIDKTRIDNLERIVYAKQGFSTADQKKPFSQIPERIIHSDLMFVRPEDLYKLVDA
jgi:hypothetical protein